MEDKWGSLHAKRSTRIRNANSKPLKESCITQAPCRDGKLHSTIIIAEVILVHVNKHVTTRTKNGSVIVDLTKYAPVSRCGGDTYARISEAYDIPRPGKEWQERSSAVK